ncbi:MAG: ArnT family glycosyltransferase [Pyrinomonadaceae bacterium]
MHPSTLAKRGTVLLFLAIVAFYFYGLGQLPLVGPDEPRYAQVAREMFLRHDLITPTLGGHTWFEKPALLYWMMILSFKLFGVTEWSARLPSAISGVLTVAAVFVVGRRLESDKDQANKLQGYAFWNTIAAATMIGIVVFSQAASFDIVLTMTTTWAFAIYFLHDLNSYSDGDRKSRSWLLAGFYVFIGLSLLAKGLVGIVLPVGVIGLYHHFRRRLPGRKTLLSVIWGLPLALIVAGTWYGPVTWRHGWLFIDQFFVQHHFARYVSNKYHHSQPVYYYLIVLPLLALPWTAFLIDGLLQFKSWLWRARTEIGDRADQSLNLLMSFTVAWLLFPLVFFSLSGSKLPGYILPILPAAALIIGRQLWRLRSDSGGWPLKTSAAIYLLFAIGALVYSWRTGNLPLTSALLVAAPLLAAGSFPFLFTRKAATSVALMAAMSVVASIVVMYFMAPAFAERESSRRLLQLADARGYSQTAIYGMQRSDRTPEFYAAGRVVYDADGEPIMYEGPGQVIEESRKRNDVLLTFVALGEVKQFNEMSSAQTEVIGANGWYAIVAVRAR